MKIRNGFVSNSSSSSFILDANKYSCLDVAKHVINILHNDDIIYRDDLLENLKNIPSKNTAIFINCSDDIQIMEKNNKIYVDASNHYHWDFDDIDYDFEEDDNYSYRIFYEPLYFLADYKYNGLLYNVRSYDDDYTQYTETYRCKECGARYYVFCGELVCPVCLKDGNGNEPKFIRKEKLKRILEDEN